MCGLGGLVGGSFLVFAIYVMCKCLFESGGIVDSLRQFHKERSYYLKHEPWRYQAYKDPDCPVNRSDRGE